MKIDKRTILVLFLCALFVSPLFAQKDSDLRKELEALKAGQDAIRIEIELQKEIAALKSGQDEIRKQLAEISRQLAARPVGPTAPTAPGAPSVANLEIDLGNNILKGSKDAKITLVEFTDYQCPYCARYTQNTLPQIQKEYIDSGRIRYALLDLPLESIHKDAFIAAEATHCAGDQGKYWEMHDRLFENQKSIQPVKAHAEALTLDVAKFEGCMEAKTHADAIRKDMVQAQNVGASGTPSFVVAKTDPNDPTKVTGLSFLRGAKSFNEFKAALDSALATNK